MYDSLLIGHTGSKKNERMAIGSFDDIKVFHRSLSEKEIWDLYKAPNPNEFKKILNEIYKYGLIILGFLLIVIVILIRNKRVLKRQNAQLALTNKISELELKVVKAQMNPHFISNCLVAIQDLVYSREIEKAGLYIAKFSFFLRQVLNYSDENYITIAEELEVIKLYIELEQLRFNNEFKFELIIEEGIDYEEILMPSLITQPFVENSVWHGLLPLKNLRPAQLTIRVLMRNGLPIIEIEDNGVGRDLLNPPQRKSKGTKLVVDKIESLNQLSNTTHYKIEIIDLQNGDKKQIGTKIIIQLENLKE
jgi:LytS/YehU family sensor histidine kinase